MLKSSKAGLANKIHLNEYLKGVDSSGADTTQSQGGSATNGNDTKTRLAQRLKASKGINLNIGSTLSWL